MISTLVRTLFGIAAFVAVWLIAVETSEYGGRALLISIYTAIALVCCVLSSYVSVLLRRSKTWSLAFSLPFFIAVAVCTVNGGFFNRATIFWALAAITAHTASACCDAILLKPWSGASGKDDARQ